MKKVLVFFMVLVFTLSMTLSALAVPGKGNNGKGNGNGGNKSEIQTTSASGSDVTATSNLWTNKPGNLVKLYTEDGKKVMFPVHALLNNGATEVNWNSEAGTVTVTGTNGITVVFTPNSTTATTKASVTLGDTSTLIPTVAVDTVDATKGTISGSVPATITDPLTGTPIVLDLSITGTISGYDSVAGTGTIDTGVTFSGDYTDAITGQVVTISGTVTGTLEAPVYALDTNSTSVDFAIPFENEVSNGRAYVPIQDLDKLFATQLAADTTTEPLPTEEPVVPAEEVPEVVPEVIS
jgi:hypothetical protein